MKRTSHYSFAVLLAAAILHIATPSSSGQSLVIGSWQDNDGDGWTDNAGGSIAASTNMPSRYEFQSNVVAGYPQSLGIHETGFGNSRLMINLTTLGGAIDAFTNGTKMQFTFSCPPSAVSTRM